MRTSVEKSYIESRVKDVTYHRIPGTTATICNIEMVNGFSVRGESACVDPKNFDEALGRKIAYENAFQNLWQLEGYLLAEEHSRTRANAFDKINFIARVCHEVNRAYCEALGDFSQVPWEEAAEWQRVSARMGVDLHLMGDFGPEASHAGWMANKVAEGWVYGDEKNAELKTHPCIVPFEHLPREQQAKDYIFREVVHSLRNVF